MSEELTDGHFLQHWMATHATLPSVIAYAALCLITNEAEIVTGVEFPIDGGCTV